MQKSDVLATSLEGYRPPRPNFGLCKHGAVTYNEPCMDGTDVSLAAVAMAALGIVTTVVGYLIKQNSAVLSQLSVAINKLSTRIDKSEDRDLQFHQTVLKYLKNIDDTVVRTYDEIHDEAKPARTRRRK